MSSSNSVVRQREDLYRLIISQLLYDGHQTLAMNLTNLVNAHPLCPPSDRLMHIVTLGVKSEEEMAGKKSLKNDTVIPSTGIDLEYESEVQSSAPEPALYETCYVTSHKAPCRAGAFSQDGMLVATGSFDASIKILDVERMLAKSSQPQDPNATGESQNPESHPVIRTLYDHLEEVTCLVFHPYNQLLVSGSRDYSIKIFDYSKSSTKHAFKTLQEAEAIRCLSFHPSGDYLLVGTQHSTLRLYDVQTGQCFVSSVPEDQHKGPITCVQYCPSANMYATSSKDGDIKIWDGVSNKVVNTFISAHEGYEVCSVAFSRNSKYLLSSGKDSLVRLWELSSSRCILVYTGAGAVGKQQHRTQAVFNHTEDYILFPDEKTTSLCSWDSRNSARKQLLSLGHNNIVKCFVHSPLAPAFLTCSDDNRARFWYKRSVSD
ncbi:hypothetical protein CHUAL_012708 [Chamberlinius hualienensis]